MMATVNIIDSRNRGELESFQYNDFRTNGVVNVYNWSLSDKEATKIKDANALIETQVTANLDKGYVSVLKRYRTGNEYETFDIIYHYNNAEVHCFI